MIDFYAEHVPDRRAYRFITHGKSDKTICYKQLQKDVIQIASNINKCVHKGYCNPFDSKVGGYVRGEGCGLVVLTRLPRQERI